MTEDRRWVRFYVYHGRIPIGSQYKALDEIKAMLEGLAKKQAWYNACDIAVWKIIQWPRHDKDYQPEKHELVAARVNGKWIDL